MYFIVRQTTDDGLNRRRYKVVYHTARDERL